jgi:hypothetical protein
LLYGSDFGLRSPFSLTGQSEPRNNKYLINEWPVVKQTTGHSFLAAPRGADTESKNQLIESLVRCILGKVPGFLIPAGEIPHMWYSVSLFIMNIQDQSKQGGRGTNRALQTILLISVLLLTACAAGQGANTSPAAKALENYLRALVDKDEARLVSLACPDWELDALLEYDSFQAVRTELSDLTCRETGSADGAVQVNCQGQILATYSEEVQEFDLGSRTYRMVQSGADWQVCGYSTE